MLSSFAEGVEILVHNTLAGTTVTVDGKSIPITDLTLKLDSSGAPEIVCEVFTRNYEDAINFKHILGKSFIGIVGMKFDNTIIKFYQKEVEL